MVPALFDFLSPCDVSVYATFVLLCMCFVFSNEPCFLYLFLFISNDRDEYPGVAIELSFQFGELWISKSKTDYYPW